MVLAIRFARCLWVAPCLLPVLFLLAGPPAALALGPIFYVKADATGANTGANWQDAFPTLERALDDASEAGGAVTQIWVAVGTYKPYASSGNRASAFLLVSGVGVYGGFVGTETSVSQRNPSANVTILSGDIGVPGVSTDNSYRVVTAIGLDTIATLDGFTIRDGNAGNNMSYLEGAGIFVQNSNLTIRNCRFLNNAATNKGGAIYCNSPAVIKECTFEGNATQELGGAIYVMQSGKVLDCRLTGNSARLGGAIYAASDSIVSGCTIDTNTAVVGAGLYMKYATVSNCKITNNAAVQVSATTLSYGGGIYAEQASTIANCLVACNSVTRLSGSGYGGGIACENSDVTIRGCTIVDNDPGAVSTVRYALPPTISNSILWGSICADVTREAPASSTALSISYSDFGTIDGTYDGTGNIMVAPHLLPDGHLRPGSPCTNAGDPFYVPLTDEKDIDGNVRVLWNRIDMGSDEFTRPGDITGPQVGSPPDCKVNVYDLQRLAASWNKQEGQPGYDPACDLNGDGKVNVYDLQILAANWNK